MQPTQVATEEHLADAIEQWEKVLRDYYEAGGSRLSDEDMRAIAGNILPTDMPFSFVPALRKI